MTRNEKIDDCIEKAYNKAFIVQKKVIDIFTDFFGSEFVDFQNVPTLIEFNKQVKKRYIYRNLTRESIAILDSKYPSITDSSIDKLTDEQLVDYLVEFSSEGNTKDIRNTYFDHTRILVYFPKVRITNEHNKFVDIKDLYAEVYIDDAGAIMDGFKLNRATYNNKEMAHDYMHSHICEIPTSDFTEFQTPCLGTGPIRTTIAILSRACDYDRWNLFCLELSKYIQVESLVGKPYNFLERLDYNTSRNIRYDNISTCISYLGDIGTEILAEFSKYFLGLNIVPFGFRNNQYCLGMPYIDYIILVSNEFIKWYNNKVQEGKYSYDLSYLMNSEILHRGIVSGNKVSEYEEQRDYDYSNYEGEYMCQFKGKDVRIHIEDSDLDKKNSSILLNSRYVSSLLYNTIKEINFKYGKENNDPITKNAWLCV